MEQEWRRSEAAEQAAQARLQRVRREVELLKQDISQTEQECDAIARNTAGTNATIELMEKAVWSMRSASAASVQQGRDLRAQKSALQQDIERLKADVQELNPVLQSTLPHELLEQLKIQKDELKELIDIKLREKKEKEERKRAAQRQAQAKAEAETKERRSEDWSTRTTAGSTGRLGDVDDELHMMRVFDEIGMNWFDLNDDLSPELD